MTDEELMQGAQRMREVASKVGPLHSYWDVIFDAEALVAGERAICSREVVERQVAEALAECAAKSDAPRAARQ